MRLQLLAQTQLGDQRGVTVSVLGLQVVQQLATTAHHAQQATATMVVLGMRLEVGGQFVDAGGQQGHLHFWATSVIGSTSVRLDDFGLDRGCDHCFSLIRPAKEAGPWFLLAPAAGTAAGVRLAPCKTL